MNIDLQTIYRESTDLLKRFELTPTFECSWRKTLEEKWELDQELFELCDLPKNHPAKEDVAKEASDLLITLCNVLYTVHITPMPDDTYYLDVSAMWEGIPTPDKSIREMNIDSAWDFQMLFSCFDAYIDGLANRLDVTRNFRRYCLSLVSMIKTAGITLLDLEKAMIKTFEKNAKKTPENYHVVNGQIARRPANEVQS